MSKRPVFRDPEIDARYERDGFVVLPAIGRGLVRPLRRAHRRLVGRAPAGFHSTPYSADTTLKLQVHSELVSALMPVLDGVLTGHRPLLASFVTKGPGGAGRMPPHQDWTFVDEPDLSSMNAWMPLVDVDHRNGAMSLLPGGHRVPFTIRGTDTENPFAQIEALAAERMIEVPMRAGDVVVHDHRVLHSSPPNSTRRARVVVGCALIPAGSTAVHYRRTAAGTLERHLLDETFFTDHTYGAATLPDSARFDRIIEFSNPELEPQDLPAVVPHDA